MKKVPEPSFEYSNSRTSIWRRKKGLGKAKKLYFGIGLSFNIDGNR